MRKLPHAKCESCPLNNPDNPAVPGFGSFNDAKVIFVGEAPGVHEEEEGIPFVGQSGSLLDAMLDEVGVPLPEAFIYKTNVVACRPPNNRTPYYEEIRCCAPRLRHELSQCKTDKIVSLGKTAHEFFNAPYKQLGAVIKWNDKLVMPNWHPAYVLRSPGEAALFKRILRRAVEGPFEFELMPKPTLVWPRTPAELDEALRQCGNGVWVAYDVETDQTQWFDSVERPHDLVMMLQIAWKEDEAVIVDDCLLHDYTKEVIPILRKFFSRVFTCAHNGKYDNVFLKSQFGLSVHLDFDTMLAHYVLDENVKHGLKGLASSELGMLDYEEDTIQPFLKNRNDWYSKVPAEIMGEYGAWDVVITLRLRQQYYDELAKQGRLEKPFYDVIMPAARFLEDVEIRGFQIDVEQFERISEVFQNRMEELAEQIREIAEWPDLNVNSTQQMGELFYDRIGFPPAKGRKIGPRSTAHQVLVALEGRHPVIAPLMEYRRVAKMLSSYVNNVLPIRDLKGRVHGTFNVPGTEIGRLSVTRPALQTIPRPEDKPPFYGRYIRSGYIAAPGMVLVVCDYSQAELRVFACLSGEPFLLDVYASNRDLHSEVAIGMYGEGYTKEQRVQCKMFNFSYLYGGNEYSFAKDAGLNISVAKKFVRNYNKLMPVGLAWKERQFELLKEQGYVETIFGRRRHFPLITSQNVDDARKSSVHMPVASTANDLTLLSGIEIEKQHPGVVLMVHDSVLVECFADEADDVANMMCSTMENVASTYFPQIPWKVDADVSHRWVEPPEHL